MTHVDRRLYTGAADAAMKRAAAQAELRDRVVITPVDLLCALISEDATGIVAAIFRSDDLAACLTALRRAVASRMSETAPSLDLVLDRALQENPTKPIGTDHLLSALLEADNTTAELLTASGITAAAVRAAYASALTSQCYGCAEADRRQTRFSIARPHLSSALTSVLRDVEHWRKEKEDAVDAHDYQRAADMREREKAVRRCVVDWDEPALITNFGEAIDEILRLRAAVDHLTSQLHSSHAKTNPPQA
ncbi:Clp protease N-terminal domain-containing protein [Nocardia neocaledoniensis]|uniref:Clp protease N-terminal domain-containing protein n=1 Tax=Nocardia neocaledoniensis TaxID=236511 RepID=UPI0033C800F8